jgi:hypothetical protein
LTGINEAKGDAEPSIPADGETRANCRKRHANGHRQSRSCSKRDQRAYTNACGRPEDSHSHLSPQGQPKPSCQEIGNADRDGELDNAEPRLADR